MKLLIDIGNSRIKWGVTGTGTDVKDCGVGSQDLRALRRRIGCLAEKHPLRKALVVSVGEEGLYRDVVELVREVTGLPVHLFESRATEAGVTSAYADPAHLGADRWAAVIAAYHLYGAPVLVCDCGSAVTLDLVGEGGYHQGGYILPGLSMSRRALWLNTANVPEADGGDLAPAADSGPAVAAGTLLQLVAAIETAYARNNRPRCVLAGGDAKFLGRFLGIPFHHDTELVLKGLAIVANQS